MTEQKDRKVLVPWYELWVSVWNLEPPTLRFLTLRSEKASILKLKIFILEVSVIWELYYLLLDESYLMQTLIVKLQSSHDLWRVIAHFVSATMEKRQTKRSSSAGQQRRRKPCSEVHLYALSTSGNKVSHNQVWEDTCSSLIEVILEMKKPLVNSQPILQSVLCLAYDILFHLAFISISLLETDILFPRDTREFSDA